MFEYLDNIDIFILTGIAIMFGYSFSLFSRFFLGISALNYKIDLINKKLEEIHDIKRYLIDELESFKNNDKEVQESCQKVIEALECGKAHIINKKEGTLFDSMNKNCNMEQIKNIARDMDIQLTTEGNKHTKKELVEAIIKFANYE